MPRVFVGGWLILLNSLLVIFLLDAVGYLKPNHGSTSGETPAPANRKFEERAPAGDLQNQSSRNLGAPLAPRAKRGDWAVLVKANKGSLWDHGGSIVGLEATGRARRFYYVEVHGASPAKTGDIAFEGVREGPTYSGRAYQFAENCAPLAFLVKGSVSADGSAVKMQGRKPQRNAQCDIISYEVEELAFRLANKL
jgi:hypothetical protein